MAVVGSAYIEVLPTMKGFSSKVNSALNGEAGSLGASSASAFSAKFQATGSSKIASGMGVIAGVASSLATTAFNAIGASMGSAIARVDQLNNFPRVMQNLGYSSEDASASIKKMSEAIDGLPTSLDSISSLTQQLAPLCDNLDEATDISIALNDALLAGGASSEDVSRAMTQYTQALSKGKPDLMDWRTLQEVMPGQLNQVAEAMLGAGRSSNDLYKALRDGKVSMQDFNKAVLSLDKEGINGFASFSQQAKDATQGIGTALENVGNRISKAIETIIQAFGAGSIADVINGFSSSFGGIADAIATTIGAIKTAFSTLTSPIKQAKDAFVGMLPEGAFDGIIKALETIAPAIGPVIVAFLGMQPVILMFLKLKTAIGGLSGVMGLLAGGPIGIAIAAIVALGVGLAALYNTNDEVKNAIDTAWTHISELAQTVWPTIQSIIEMVWQGIQDFVVPIIQAVADFITNNWDTIFNVISTVMAAIQNDMTVVWPIIQTVIQSAMNIIQSIIQIVMGIINGDWGAVWDGICSIASSVWTIITSVIDGAITGIMAVISGILGTIQGVWDSAWNAVLSAVGSIWDGIVSGVSNGINTVLDTVTGIKDSIVNFFAGAGQWLLDSGKAIIDGLVEGIQNAIGGAIDAVSGAVSSIRDLFPFSPAKKGPFSGHGWVLYSGMSIMNALAEGVQKRLGSATHSIGSAMQSIADLTSVDGNYSLAYSIAGASDAQIRANRVANRNRTTTSEILAGLKTLGSDIRDYAKATEKRETAVYVDGKKLASSLAKPLNQQLGVMARRGV